MLHDDAVYLSMRGSKGTSVVRQEEMLQMRPRYETVTLFMNAWCKYLKFNVQRGKFFEGCSLGGKAKASKNDAAGGK